MITLRNDVVRVRKEHKCFGCLDVINIGENAIYLVEKDGGNFLISYWCKSCYTYMENNSHYFEDGINDGEMWENDGYIEFRKIHTGINSLPKKI